MTHFFQHIGNLDPTRSEHHLMPISLMLIVVFSVFISFIIFVHSIILSPADRSSSSFLYFAFRSSLFLPSNKGRKEGKRGAVTAITSRCPHFTLRNMSHSKPKKHDNSHTCTWRVYNDMKGIEIEVNFRYVTDVLTVNTPCIYIYACVKVNNCLLACLLA